MLTLTNSAGAHLNHLLMAKSDTAVARITQGPRRMHLLLGELRAGDQKFSHAGRVVLALDSKVAESLSKRQLDLRASKSGPRLRLVTET